MLAIVTYSQACFEDLRKCMCYIFHKLYASEQPLPFFRGYPGLQSLTLLLSLRVVTKVYVGQRIKGRKEWPELFSTARTAPDGWNQ